MSNINKNEKICKIKDNYFECKDKFDKSNKNYKKYSLSELRQLNENNNIEIIINKNKKVKFESIYPHIKPICDFDNKDICFSKQFPNMKIKPKITLFILSYMLMLGLSFLIFYTLKEVFKVTPYPADTWWKQPFTLSQQSFIYSILMLWFDGEHLLGEFLRASVILLIPLSIFGMYIVLFLSPVPIESTFVFDIVLHSPHIIAVFYVIFKKKWARPLIMLVAGAIWSSYMAIIYTIFPGFVMFYYITEGLPIVTIILISSLLMAGLTYFFEKKINKKKIKKI